MRWSCAIGVSPKDPLEVLDVRLHAPARVLFQRARGDRAKVVFEQRLERANFRDFQPRRDAPVGQQKGGQIRVGGRRQDAELDAAQVVFQPGDGVRRFAATLGLERTRKAFTGGVKDDAIVAASAFERGHGSSFALRCGKRQRCKDHACATTFPKPSHSLPTVQFCDDSSST